MNNAGDKGPEADDFTNAYRTIYAQMTQREPAFSAESYERKADPIDQRAPIHGCRRIAAAAP